MPPAPKANSRTRVERIGRSIEFSPLIECHGLARCISVAQPRHLACDCRRSLSPAILQRSQRVKLLFRTSPCQRLGISLGHDRAITVYLTSPEAVPYRAFRGDGRWPAPSPPTRLGSLPSRTVSQPTAPYCRPSLSMGAAILALSTSDAILYRRAWPLALPPLLTGLAAVLALLAAGN